MPELGCMQERDACKRQSSVCGQTRSVTRDAHAGFQYRATRVMHVGTWGYAGDQPGLVTWAQRGERSFGSKAMPWVREARRAGRMWRDAHAEGGKAWSRVAVQADSERAL